MKFITKFFILLALFLNLNSLSAYQIQGKVLNNKGKGIRGVVIFFPATNLQIGKIGPTYKNGIFWFGDTNEWFLSDTITVLTDPSGNYKAEIPDNGLTYTGRAFSQYDQYTFEEYDPYGVTPITYKNKGASVDFVLGDVQNVSNNDPFYYNVKDNKSQSISANIYFVERNSSVTPNTFKIAYQYYTNSKGSISHYGLKTDKEYIMLVLPADSNYVPGFVQKDFTTALIWQNAETFKYTQNSNGGNVNIKCATQKNNNLNGLRSLIGTIFFNGGISNVKENEIASDIPVKGAIISVYDENEKIVGISFSDLNGNYKISKLINGKYKLQVINAGFDYADQFVTLSDASSNSTVVDMKITKGNGLNSVNEIIELTSGLTPMPVTGISELNFESFNNQTEIKIITLNGEVVKQESIQTSVGNNSYKIDSKELNSGTYFITITGKNEVKFAKFIVN